MSVAESTENKATFRRFQEAANTGSAEAVAKMIDEVVAPDARIHTPLPIEATGAQVLVEVFTRLLAAFPDLHIEVEDMIAEGDKVVCRNRVTGTHQGVYMGIPPTGNPIAYNEIFIVRFAGGRITETWGIVDGVAQLRQLGVLPDGPFRRGDHD